MTDAPPNDCAKTWYARRKALRWDERDLLKRAGGMGWGIIGNIYLLADWEDGTREPSEKARRAVEAALQQAEAEAPPPPPPPEPERKQKNLSAPPPIPYAETGPLSWRRRCDAIGLKYAHLMDGAGLEGLNSIYFTRWSNGTRDVPAAAKKAIENALAHAEREADRKEDRGRTAFRPGADD